MQGKKAGVGQSNIEEKTETRCWLCDKYGKLASNCRLRNFRLIRHKDNECIYTSGRILEPEKNC